MTSRASGAGAGQRSNGRPYASLHTKLLVIDGRRALIGSANLTDAALTRNLEAGLLIRDAALATDLEQHVRRLMEADVLCRM